MRKLLVAVLILLATAPRSYSDSIFDIRGIGRDVIPTVGRTRSLAGAVVADRDPLSCSILNPCASAFAEKITISTGFAHTSTNSNNLGLKQRTITTLFPSIAVIVPIRNVSVLTGLFLEKQGRVSLADTGSYNGAMYDVDFRKESSVHSVPVFVSAPLSRRLILSAGIIFSFFDTRDNTTIDFRSTDYSDTDDTNDTSANGQTFAASFLLDLNRLRIGALFRGKSDMDGAIDKSNDPIGLWGTDPITISSKQAFEVGLFVKPADALSFEVDYDRTPWSKVLLNDENLVYKSVQRFSVGVEYRGDHIWRASKYPLNIGYYRQPLGWETQQTGEIIEEMYSIGTSIPLAEDRATMFVALEIGRREAENRSDLDEETLGFSLSISAVEAWRRSMRR